MQTADIAKSKKCWCERIWAADLARSAPLTLRSHALLTSFIKVRYVRNQNQLAGFGSRLRFIHSTERKHQF